jgi:predicted Na+-dependent transporter
VLIERLIAWIRERMERWTLYLVLLVGAIALWLPAPGRALDRGDYVYITLAVLVFTAGLTVDLASFAAVRRGRWRMLAVLAASSVLLPLLAWGLSQLVSGQLRDAMLAVGVAPSEVASLALVGFGAGDVVTAAALVLASTLITIAMAGPLLTLFAHASHLDTTGLAGTLVLVVAIPLLLGVGVGTRLAPTGITRAIAAIVGNLALLMLIWEVASQVVPEAAYLIGTLLLILFVIGCMLIGAALSFGTSRSVRIGIVMPVAIRDFAIAAGIATAAFGASTTGLLGIYGLLVLVFGTLAARILSSRLSPG